MWTSVLKRPLRVSGVRRLELRAVGDDAALAHEEDAIDLGEISAMWWVISRMPVPCCGEFLEQGAEIGLRGEIKGIRGLVQQAASRAEATRARPIMMRRC